MNVRQERIRQAKEAFLLAEAAYYEVQNRPPDDPERLAAGEAYYLARLHYTKAVEGSRYE